MKIEEKQEVIELRKQGYSINEIKQKVPVSKGTISVWVQNVVLSPSAQKRLDSQSTNARLRSQETIRKQTIEKHIHSKSIAEKIVRGVDLNSSDLAILCAMIYWCEGNKELKSVSFTNSDPKLISLFLALLRKSFNIQESKLRVLMHLHSYHNEEKQKKFWSQITHIPVKNFSRTYLKPHTGLYKKENYPGCIRIGYHDVELARQLSYIAKLFMERYK